MLRFALEHFGITITMKYPFLLIILLSFTLTSCFHTRTLQAPVKPEISYKVPVEPLYLDNNIKPGAERTRQYFNRLKHDLRVGVVANQTSVIHNTHLVDSLLSAGINVIKVFTPEHGFRGNVDAGVLINNETDASTGLPIISLYGDHKKPTAQDLQDVELMVFDLQDVGARFYTYISTMTLVMEACAEAKIPLLILDRPNPNGFYVDGPILEPKYKSFVGMHSVPIVHGMTMAEYARMVNEEGWLKDSVKCDLHWIMCSGYNHRSIYKLPVKPSPNLPDENSVLLYPSLCLFEGTKVSVGRGTDYPFSIIGYPASPIQGYKFTPVSKPGAMDPPYKNQQCFGLNLRDSADSIIKYPQLRLHWLIDLYQADTNKQGFFTSFFYKLAGTDTLRYQIESGMDEAAIRNSWTAGLEQFKEIRKKYLLYRDFE